MKGRFWPSLKDSEETRELWHRALHSTGEVQWAEGPYPPGSQAHAAFSVSTEDNAFIKLSKEIPKTKKGLGMM